MKDKDYKTFVETKLFSRKWLELGLNDEDLQLLQNVLIETPNIGKVIPGTGSLRKLRISMPCKGKRGGARVCYVNFLLFDTIYLIDVYSKNEKENLTEGEKAIMKKYIQQIEKELKANE